MCVSIMIAICIKQHLNNIWNSIHKKVKQHWGWVEKSVAYKEKRVCFICIANSIRSFKRKISSQKRVSNCCVKQLPGHMKEHESVTTKTLTMRNIFENMLKFYYLEFVSIWKTLPHSPKNSIARALLAWGQNKRICFFERYKCSKYIHKILFS